MAEDKDRKEKKSLESLKKELTHIQDISTKLVFSIGAALFLWYPFAKEDPAQEVIVEEVRKIALFLTIQNILDLLSRLSLSKINIIDIHAILQGIKKSHETQSTQISIETDISKIKEEQKTKKVKEVKKEINPSTSTPSSSASPFTLGLNAKLQEVKQKYARVYSTMQPLVEKIALINKSNNADISARANTLCQVFDMMIAKKSAWDKLEAKWREKSDQEKELLLTKHNQQAEIMDANVKSLSIKVIELEKKEFKYKVQVTCKNYLEVLNGTTLTEAKESKKSSVIKIPEDPKSLIARLRRAMPRLKAINPKDHASAKRILTSLFETSAELKDTCSRLSSKVMITQEEFPQFQDKIDRQILRAETLIKKASLKNTQRFSYAGNRDDEKQEKNLSTDDSELLEDNNSFEY
ncbi:MAG TPA: hypothetical protein VHE99_12820 [Gammaproteobacteria bacterium]|nr:hypothetical protein [Gammaproteobacteria bacterium]